MRASLAAALLLVAVCAALKPTPAPTPSLPPYASPGSWLGAFSGYAGADKPVRLMAALWDGTTGANYTITIAEGYEFIVFNPNTVERIIAMSYTLAGDWSSNVTIIALLKYAPKSAPAIYASCAMPFYALDAYPFVMGGKAYAMSENILYSLAFPAQPDPETPCEITVLQPLPTQYTPFCSLSLQSNHAAYVDGKTLVEIWWSANGTITITSQDNTPVGEWVWLQVRPAR